MITSNLERIHAAVTWYATINKGFDDIETLMEARRRLSCHLFAFALEVGGLNREKNRTEHLRRSRYARTVAEMLEQSGGKNVAAAKEAADYKTSRERGEEGMAEAEYYAAKLIHEAGKDVLDTLCQHISNIKMEKRLEFSGQGSQNI